MRLSSRCIAAVLFAHCLIASSLPSQELLKRLDNAAAHFQSMRANVTWNTHTDVINEDNNESGTVLMKKSATGQVQGLIQFTSKDQRTVALESRRVQIYYPKIKTVQQYDLDKHGEQLDRFILIGFGTSGNELAKDYVVQDLGHETLKLEQDVETIHLELIPRSGEARELVKKLELWIPAIGEPYPRKEKITQASGDYQIITYSDMKINPPLAAGALELKLPPGVKTVNSDK